MLILADSLSAKPEIMIVLPRLAINILSDAEPHTRKLLALDFAEHVINDHGTDAERSLTRTAMSCAREFLAEAGPIAAVSDARSALFTSLYDNSRLLWLPISAITVACLPALQAAGAVARSVPQTEVEYVARHAQQQAAHATVGGSDNKQRWEAARWEEARWQLTRIVESAPTPW